MEPTASPDNRHYVEVPGLATLVVDPRNNEYPVVTISLDPKYSGELDDLLGGSFKPGGIYFTGTRAVAWDNPELAALIEAAHHHDHDRDGQTDSAADQFVKVLLGVLSDCRIDHEPFRRPDAGMFTRLVMAMMPPPPERHIRLGYGDMRLRYRKQHVGVAIAMLLVVLATVNLQLSYLPWTSYSVISALLTVGEQAGWWIAGAIVVSYVLINRRIGNLDGNGHDHSRRTFGLLNKAATFEEQAFRQGSENWNLQERARSCVAFGLIHLVNLWYPIAAILPLAMGGAFFMYIYLREFRQSGNPRTAVLSAALHHVVYNWVVLAVLAVYLVVLLGWVLATSIALFTFLAKGLAMALGFLRTRRVRATNPSIRVPSPQRAA